MFFNTIKSIDSIHMSSKNHILCFCLLSSYILSANANECVEVDSRFEPLPIQNTVSLCRTEFELTYSPEKKITLWSAERLTGTEANDTEPRMNLFKADPDLERNERAELSDYVASGYDRGHIVPAGDMHTLEGMLESFYLSNVMPQVPNINRGIWKVIEQYAKDLALSYGEVIIFTGPVLDKSIFRIGNNSIPVPTAMFKVIYLPAKNESWSFIIPNEKQSTKDISKKLVTLSDIQTHTGFRFLPNQQNVKEHLSVN